LLALGIVPILYELALGRWLTVPWHAGLSFHSTPERQLGAS
jgi:hypothetical protein